MFNPHKLLAELTAVSTGVPQVLFYHENGNGRDYGYMPQPEWDEDPHYRENNSIDRIIHKCNVMFQAKGVLVDG